MGKLIDITKKLKKKKYRSDWSEFSDWEWEELFEIRDIIHRLPISLILVIMSWCRDELKFREEN